MSALSENHWTGLAVRALLWRTIMLTHSGRLCVAVALFHLGACGSSSYLVSSSTQEQALRLRRSSPEPLAATAEPSGDEVRVAAAKMRWERAEPVDHGRFCVRPRRPVALLTTGSVLLAMGVGLIAGGLATAFPPDTGGFNESGIAVGVELGLGAPLALVGTILTIVGAARWSPELR